MAAYIWSPKSSRDAGGPSSVSASEAWKALAVIRAIYESAESGKPQKVLPAPA